MLGDVVPEEDVSISIRCGLLNRVQAMNFRCDRHLTLLGKEEELLKKPGVVISSDQKAAITRGELFALAMDIKTEIFSLSGI